MSRATAGLIAVAALLSACAGTPAALRPQAVQAAASRTEGYLSGPLIQALADAVLQASTTLARALQATGGYASSAGK